jgi:hypothetical protein
MPLVRKIVAPSYLALKVAPANLFSPNLLIDIPGMTV